MNRAQRDQQAAEKAKKAFEKANKIFFFYDSFLVLLSLIFVFVYIHHRCVSLMFLYYAFFYSAQAGQHYMIQKFPLIDINKHFVLYRRLVMFIGFVDASYLFAAIIFWQKTSQHPMYCALHEYFGIGMWVGIILSFHFIFCLFWVISLIQSYINRRYYLLALGGFEVEQRILEQNRAIQETMVHREPDFDHTFSVPKSDHQKYFKFEDAIEESLQQYECSICYNSDLDSHYVDAGCGHFYHQTCLQTWAKLNQTCPQCRHQFEESQQKPEKPQQHQESAEQ